VPLAEIHRAKRVPPKREHPRRPPPVTPS
jgi:hypothetical protein